MALTSAQKAACLLLLLDPETREQIFESFSPEEKAFVEEASIWVANRPQTELRKLVVEVCLDPLLKLPIAERDLEEWFSKRESAEKKSLLSRGTVTRILLRLDPRTLLYRK
ncbi:MAG: hypothetical protein ABIH23_07210 [bacterium]